MHDYLRAVGFSCIKNKKDMAQVLNMVMSAPEYSTEAKLFDNGCIGAERSREFAANAGIAVRGELDEQGAFSYDYFFPYYNGSNISLNEDVAAQKHSDRDEFDGICDILDQGVTLIFHLNHLADYTGDGVECEEDDDLRKNGRTRFMEKRAVKLSALSISGKVLIPLLRSADDTARKKKQGVKHLKMLEEAKSGNQEAIENLTIEQLDTYAMAMKRLETEDVLSIVESYFMPYGITCDQYSILGDIVSCHQVFNQYTGEVLYQMTVLSNDILLDICMNKDDLLGEPKPGRRFSGSIWLQGILEKQPQ